MQENNRQNNSSNNENNNPEHWQTLNEDGIQDVNKYTNQASNTVTSDSSKIPPISISTDHQKNINQYEVPTEIEQRLGKDSKLNPYQAPNSLNPKYLDNQFMEENNSTWYGTSGRIGRLRYLSYSIVTSTLLSLALGIVAGILAVALTSVLGESGEMIGGMIYLLAMIPGYVFQFFIIPRRRLHDLDKSGWYLLIMVIPVINIFLILYLCFARGNDGENGYGLPNRENQWWHYLLGVIIPVFYFIAIIGILAAIAIPAYQDYIDRSEKHAVENFEQMIEDAQ